jgi:hypothetical protein
MQETKVTKVILLMDVLKDGEWHWADELAARVGWRFGATIKEARDKSYLIETNRVGLKHRYRLVRS